MNDILGDFKRKVANNKFKDEEWSAVLMQLYADIKTETTLAVVNRNLRWKRKNEDIERRELMRDYYSVMEDLNDFIAVRRKRLRKIHFKHKYTKIRNGKNRQRKS